MRFIRLFIFLVFSHLKFLLLMQIFISTHEFFVTCSFTMRTLFKKCNVITVKDHDNKELIAVNLRLIDEFSH